MRADDVEAARKRMDEINLEVKTERERGVLMAARGIASSMSKGKEGTLQTWDAEKIKRAAKAITDSEMADEFDQGYAETLLDYAKLIPAKA